MPDQTSKPSVNDPKESTLITRRRLLFGAIGGGAVAIGAGAFALNARSHDDTTVDSLTVPESALVTLNDFTSLESYEGKVVKTGEYDLPHGSLLWANGDSVAACLLPGEAGSPLAQVGLLALGSGTLTTVLEEAVNTKDGFEIYDTRATSTGLVWTEANALDNTWKIYSARISNGTITSPQLADEGDARYDMPTLAAAGGSAFWQVLPKQPNDDNLPSQLKKAAFGSSDASVVYECARKMATPPYAAGDSVVITPRVDSPTVYHQVVNIDAKSGETLEEITLPASMRPLEAGYGKNGFMFSFADIYSMKGAIANLGTYTPMEAPRDGDYDGATWFGFARTPTAAPAWCNNLFIVKSSYAICGVDLKSREYFAIDVDNGADTYGEYLASSGTNDTFVTFTNIDYTPVGSDPVKTCRVKVWASA